MTAALRAQIPIPPAPGMSNASRWHLLGKSTAAWGLQLESLLVEQQVPGVAGGCSLHLRGAQPQSKSPIWMGLEQPGHLARAGEMLLSPEHCDCKKVCLLASTLQLAIKDLRVEERSTS